MPRTNLQRETGIPHLKAPNSDEYDFIVIGGGVAGVEASLSAVKLGAKTLLIEKSLIGGQSSWTGCVPSKALISAASHVYQRNRSHSFGIPSCPITRHETNGALSYAREMILRVSNQKDMIGDLSAAGVETVFGSAVFHGMDRIQLADSALRAKQFVIATGSRPKIPQIDGLALVGFRTNKTLFDLSEVPETLVVIGNEPSGIEMAQAFARLGCRVSIITQSSRLLEREEPEFSDALTDILREEGVQIHFRAEVERVNEMQGKNVVHVRVKNKEKSVIESKAAFEIIAEEILIVSGRTPNVEELNLAKASVKTLKEGIWVDEFLRTSNPVVWACGDVNGSHQFAHIAEYEAKLAVENALLSFDKRRKYSAAPYAIFTDPELARVGMTEEEVRTSGAPYKIFRSSFNFVDRALIEGVASGSVKIAANAQTGRILGAHILGPHAGELIHEIALAMANRLTVEDLARLIRVYPTLSECIGTAARSGEESLTTGIGKGWWRRFLS